MRGRAVSDAHDDAAREMFNVLNIDPEDWRMEIASAALRKAAADAAKAERDACGSLVNEVRLGGYAEDSDNAKALLHVELLIFARGTGGA